MNWTTIHTVTYPSEAHTIKMQLELEGFEVFLKDELTVQVDNFYSNAIGGVKIQVPEIQAKEGILKLIELKYIKEEHSFEESKSALTNSQAILLNKIVKIAIAALLIGFATYFAFS